MANDLTLHTQRDPRGDVVTTLLGELDMSSASRLLDTMSELPAPPSVLDCRYLSFVGARGLRSLIDLRAAHDIALRPSRALTLVLVACGLTDSFHHQVSQDPPALGTAPFAVALYDADIRFTYVNEMMAEINGLPVEAHLRSRPREVLSIEEGDLTPDLERAVAQGVRSDLLVEADAGGVEVVARCTITRVAHDGGVGALAVVQQVDPDAAAALRARRLRFSTAA